MTSATATKTGKASGKEKRIEQDMVENASKISVRPAQINARIDPDLKAKGDKAFANAGISPTTAIRSLWKKAADFADDPNALSELIISDVSNIKAKDEKKERKKRLKAAEEGSHIFENALLSVGVSLGNADSGDYDPNVAEFSDHDLRTLKEKAYLERYGINV